MQRRFLHSPSRPVELRTDDGKPSRITGYAAVFYSESDPGSEYELFSFPGYRVCERLMPGCFDRAMKEDDVRALFNHDPSLILGRMKAGTLRLSVDSTGLRYEIEPGDTSVSRDVMDWLRRGEVSGSSFAFDPVDESERKIETKEMFTRIIEVRSVKLYDVGPVTYPAYTSTTATARSLDLESHQREFAEHQARKRAALRTRIGARITELEM